MFFASLLLFQRFFRTQLPHSIGDVTTDRAYSNEQIVVFVCLLVQSLTGVDPSGHSDEQVTRAESDRDKGDRKACKRHSVLEKEKKPKRQFQVCGLRSGARAPADSAPTEQQNETAANTHITANPLVARLRAK